MLKRLLKVKGLQFSVSVFEARTKILVSWVNQRLPHLSLRQGWLVKLAVRFSIVTCYRSISWSRPTSSTSRILHWTPTRIRSV